MKQNPSHHLIEPDIIRFVQRKFGPQADLVIEKLLTHCRETPDYSSSRLLRCIVFAARDVAGVDHYIELASIDYRDLIMCGEYRQRPGAAPLDLAEHVRDLTLPFRDDQESGDD